MMSPMARRLTLLVLLAAGPVLCCRRLPPNKAVHAVILITLDTTRGDLFDWDDEFRFPSLKRLFANGIRFDQAVTAAPVTGPAHATILSGLDPLEHGVLTNPTPLGSDVMTLAERLRGLGYRTAAFVSCSLLGAGRGFEQGFEHYDADVDAPYAPRFFERTASATTDRALEWLQREDAAPYFVWLHYFDAHAPYDPPEGYRPRDFPYFERRPRLRPTLERLRQLHRRQTTPPPRLADYYRALYRGELDYIDGQLGRLLRFIASRPYAERTAFLLTADHGEELADHHGFFGHARSLYDGVMRVPLALTYPGVQPRRVSSQVTNGGIVATVLDILGEPIPAELFPSLLDDHPDHPQFCIKEPRPALGRWGVAVRTPPWKYLYWEDGREELYELTRDPGERADLAGAHTDVRNVLRERIQTDIVTRLASEEMQRRIEASVDERTRAMLRALGYLDPEGEDRAP
jgi:arylsulfatase A-like enzyme